jgi:tetratricopeptide (TPR) repeat protein
MQKIILFLLVSISVTFASSNEYIKEQYLKSYNYEQIQKYNEAIKVLAPLYKQYPKTYALNLRIGWLYYLNKNYNSAIYYYENALKINMYSLDTRLGLIRIYLDTYSFHKAEIKAYELLKVDYYNYYANFYAIKALIAQKKYSIATNIVKKILYLYPTDIKYLEQLAIIYKLTNNTLLKKLYQDILILDPNNVLVKSDIR